MGDNLARFDAMCARRDAEYGETDLELMREQRARLIEQRAQLIEQQSLIQDLYLQNHALQNQLRSKSVVPHNLMVVPDSAFSETVLPDYSVSSETVLPDSSSHDTVLKQILQQYVGKRGNAFPSESDIPKDGDLVFATKSGDGMFPKFKKNQWGRITGVDIHYEVSWFKPKLGTTKSLKDAEDDIKSTSKTSLVSNRFTKVADKDFDTTNSSARSRGGRRLTDRFIRESIRCQES